MPRPCSTSTGSSPLVGASTCDVDWRAGGVRPAPLAIHCHQVGPLYRGGQKGPSCTGVYTAGQPCSLHCATCPQSARKTRVDCEGTRCSEGTPSPNPFHGQRSRKAVVCVAAQCNPLTCCPFCSYGKSVSLRLSDRASHRLSPEWVRRAFTLITPQTQGCTRAALRRFTGDCAGCNSGRQCSGDNRSPAVPKCSNTDRAANRPWGVACGNSHPERRRRGSNAQATTAAGRRRKGPSRRPAPAAAGSRRGSAHNRAVRHWKPSPRRSA
jgi:hypothetical protein